LVINGSLTAESDCFKAFTGLVIIGVLFYSSKVKKSSW